MIRTGSLVRRAIAAVIMSGLSIALIVWASSLLVSNYWIGGIIFFLLAAFIISIEIWLFVALLRARRYFVRSSGLSAAKTNQPER
ncbi:MAG: hypothetical protein QOH44_1628 [Actinomycetota bacterium]|nr:hypothetical protein [Actinomycetota bacterium]